MKLFPPFDKYRTLDGLRGGAALVVMVFHSHWLFGRQIAQGGYLAVDLFFGLSGFVLAHAYEQRLLSGMKFVVFLKLRLARLFPLYVLGITMGFIIAFFSSLGGGKPSGILVMEFLVNLAMFPYPFDQTSNLFPLDVPAWSLFFELLINLVYSSIAFRLKDNVLIIGVLLSFLALVGFSLNADGLDLGSHWADFGAGFARTVFSFLLGIIIYRNREALPQSSIGAWCIVLVVVALILPIPLPLRAVYDLLVVAVLFPTICVMATGNQPSPNLSKFYATLGNASYGIYIIHYPCVMFARWLMKKSGIPGGVIAMFLLPTIIVLCIALDKYFDRPLRNFLYPKSARLRPSEASVP